jgi:hypothetical protein
MRIQKKIITFSVFITLLIAVCIPVVIIANAETTGSFYVYLTLGNSNPEITWVNSSVSASPIEKQTRTVYIQFNVTDANGVGNLNDASAKIYLNKVGEQQRYNTSCSPLGNSGLTETYNCAINMQYYDSPGAWIINVSIEDNSNAYDENTSFTFTYGTLTAMVVGTSELNFSGVDFGASNVAADQNPINIDNTGNVNITNVNITAFTLAKGAETINANLFTVNASNSGGAGTSLSNGEMVKVPNAMPPRDITGTDANSTLYFYVDVPSEGLTGGLFNATSAWIVTVD